MEENKESVLNNYPNIISYECMKKIIEQMERNICKINIGEEQGTGFFCKIKTKIKIIMKLKINIDTIGIIGIKKKKKII